MDGGPAGRRPPSPDNPSPGPAIVQKQFQDLLHAYKLEVFHKEHDRQSLEEISKACMHTTEDILRAKFDYHFHKLPDANRAEIINMINNYVREAVLPPVVERIVQRQVRLENRLESTVRLIEQMLAVLSSNNGVSSSR
jgi:hypothetical protein